MDVRSGRAGSVSVAPGWDHSFASTAWSVYHSVRKVSWPPGRFGQMYECLLSWCASCAALNGCVRSRYSDMSHVRTVDMLMRMKTLAILMIALLGSVIGAIRRASPNVDARPTAQRIFVGFDCRERPARVGPVFAGLL